MATVQPLKRCLVDDSEILAKRQRSTGPKAPKPRTWRVRQIPVTVDQTILRSQLEPLFNSESVGNGHQEENIIQLTLTPSSRGHACATITVSSPPRQIPYTTKEGYRIDDDFLGITPLYDSGASLVDIIAVPGLGGHALGSFKSKDGHEVWLRDFLPTDVPGIRVLLYGYDTKLANSHSNSSIQDLAKTLLGHLQAFRERTKTSRRPIILIGHSLGGLVIKEALALAHHRDGSKNEEFFLSSYGLLLFGVPNMGLRNEQLRAVVSQQPNRQLTENLLVGNDSEPSHYLKELSQKFKACCKVQKPGFEIVSFYEREESATIVETDGKLSNTGPPTLLVTEFSAVQIGIYDNFHQQYPLHANHSGLVKFNNCEDGGYELVQDKLRELVDAAPEIVVSCDDVDGKMEGSAKLLQRRLKESLFFPEILARQEQISEAHTGTCRWIFGSQKVNANGDKEVSDDYIYAHQEVEVPEAQPWPDFAEWLKCGQELYWISGKLGSGKSTLMNYIRDEKAQTKAYLDYWAQGSDLIMAFFYLWNPGTDLQKNCQGLLRSLLYQIFDQRPDLIESTIGQPFTSEQKSDISTIFLHTWTERRLIDTLRDFLENKPRSISICFFIDGLDEFVGNQHTLLDIIRLLHGTPQVKVCASSRPEQIFRLELRNFPHLRLQDFNQRDLLRTIHDKLGPPLSRKFMRSDDLETEYQVNRLIRHVCAGAQGVFLWVDIVINDVLTGILNEDTLPELTSKLDAVPDSIEDLYKHMLGRLSPSYREVARHYFQLLMTLRNADIPTKCSLLHLACMENEAWQHTLNHDKAYFTSKPFFDLCDIVETRVLTRCAGLVEFTGSQSTYRGIYYTEPLRPYSHRTTTSCQGGEKLARYWREIRFVHRSAYDFIRKDYLGTTEDKYSRSTGLLRYARGQVGLMALLPSIAVTEDLFYSQRYSDSQYDKGVALIGDHIECLVRILYESLDSEQTGQLNQARTREVARVIELGYETICSVDKDLNGLPTCWYEHYGNGFDQYDTRDHLPFQDVFGFAAYFGFRDFLSSHLASHNSASGNLNHYLICVMSGFALPKHFMSGRSGPPTSLIYLRPETRSCVPFLETIAMLLRHGVDPNTKMQESGVYGMNFEYSAWEAFLQYLAGLKGPPESSLWFDVCKLFLSTDVNPNASILSLDVDFEVTRMWTQLKQSGCSVFVVWDKSVLSLLRSLTLSHDWDNWKELDKMLQSRHVSESDQRRARLMLLMYGGEGRDYHDRKLYRLGDHQSSSLMRFYPNFPDSLEHEETRAHALAVEEIMADLTEADIINPDTFVIRSSFLSYADDSSEEV